MTIDKYLKGNKYPGRVLIAGNSNDGSIIAAYAIMGRSENSRNRIFTLEDGYLKTKAFDESKVEDPSLIIYNAGIKLNNYFILTNGDQSDTIKEELINGGSLTTALLKREYEPDSPAYTSRISALFDERTNTSSLSIIKKANDACERVIWNYPVIKGKAHIIHTYLSDGNPLPAFKGDPALLDIPSNIDELTSLIWSSLDEDNRISLYVRVKDEEKIINKNIK